MFGGWTSGVALGAVMNSSDAESKPSAMTINFVNRVEVGANVTIRTRQIGGSRSVQHWLAELTPTGSDVTLAMATVALTNRRESDGHVQHVMPHGPDPETLEEFHPPGPEGSRVMVRPISGQGTGVRTDTRSTAWLRDMTGRRVDHIQLAFLADQIEPRPFFWSGGPRPSATVSMTIYFHGTQDELDAIGDDYILSEVTGSRGESSTAGAHSRIWSRSSALVATSEQLCWYR